MADYQIYVDKSNALPKSNVLIFKYVKNGWCGLNPPFGEIKKGQVTHIAPLQLFILATFRSWGSSKGADRIRLARANVNFIFVLPIDGAKVFLDLYIQTL